MKKFLCEALVFIAIIGVSIGISFAQSEGDLAQKALTNKDDFFNETIYSLGEQLSVGGSAIYKTSSLCFYHTQSTVPGSTANSVIRYIIDIDGSNLKINGVETTPNIDDPERLDFKISICFTFILYRRYKLYNR